MAIQGRLHRIVTGLLALSAFALLGADAPKSRFRSSLHVTGMTYVSSRGSANELVLVAQRAELRPETNLAVLDEVQVSGMDPGRTRSFEVRCDRGELDVDTNDFLAEGDVRGSTGDGQRYQTEWVRYDHARGLLYTDAPVAMEDASGSFRGDGFRYDTRRKSFRLLGNVSVVQKP
jgi:LPS export ABC transporter protein LptC